MTASYKFIVLAAAIALGNCVAVGRVGAQELKTDIVPGSPAAQGQVAPVPANPPAKITQSSVSLEKDSASSVGHHHYNSDAERAQDDLLITEVKSALAEDGISKGYPVEVDADHGTVTLSGVVASGEDVKTAAEDAAGVHGVVAVRNQLRPH
jgi:osmotically-inducible protein OsmY